MLNSRSADFHDKNRNFRYEKLILRSFIDEKSVKSSKKKIFPFFSRVKMSAAIAESAWVNRAQYEGAWEAYQVYKATGQTVQVGSEIY